MTSPYTDYRFIPLTQGQFAIVDERDFDWLMQWKWFALWSKTKQGFYAARNSKVIGGNRAHLRMNRLILGLDYGDPRVGDHCDGNTLNNLRSNLRIVTRSQNNQNSRRRISNTSGFKGVVWHEQSGKWRTRITVDGKPHHIGLYSTPELAHEAYCQASRLHHGEFGRTA